MKYPKLLVEALCLLALSIAPELCAQQTSPARRSNADQEPQEETVVLPAFTVASDTVDRYRAADSISTSRVRTQLIETPSSISVLTRDIIDDIKPARLADVTRYIAGVQTTVGQAMYVDQQVTRGFWGGGHTIDNFADPSSMNTEEALVERIEITKGPNSLLTPNGSPGGAMNIVTKSPRFKRHGELTGLLGEYDAQKMTLDFGDTIDGAGRFSYRLISSYQDSRREYSSKSKLRNRLIAPQIAWRINETSELVVKYHYHDTHVPTFPYMIIDTSVTERGQKPVLAPGFSRKGRNGSPSWSQLYYAKKDVIVQFNTSINKYITTRIAGHWQHAPSGSDQTVLNTPSSANRYNPYTGRPTPDQVWALLDSSLPHDEVSNPYLPTDSPFYDPTALQVRALRGVGDFDKEYSFQNDWTLNFEIPMAKFQTVTGWSYRDGEGGNLGFVGTMNPVNLYDLANYDETPTWTTVPSANRGRSWEIFQAYLNQRVSLFEDRLSLTGGILYFETDSRNVDYLSGQPPSRLDASKDIYLGSILYRITPFVSVYYGYSTNASPSNANFQIRWAEGIQHEVGVKTELFSRRLSVNIAYFDITQTNGSVGNPLYWEGGDLSQPPSIFRDFGSHGLELEVAGAVTRNLSVLGAVSYVKLRDPLGRQVAGVSDWAASALLNYRFNTGPLDGFSLNLGVSYVGERPDFGPPTDFSPVGVRNQHELWKPSYTLLNGGISYSWSRYVVGLSVENITNNKDFKVAFGRASGFPTAFERNIRLAATVKF